MELQSLLSNFNSPKEGLEYLKDRTNNNVNWENLSKASEEIAKNQGGDKDSIALQIIGQYSQGENPLFNFEELKAPPAIQGKDLQKYDTNITSLEGIKNLGLDVIDTLGLTGFSENASKRRQDTMRYLQQSAKDNIPYNNLDEQSYWALSGMKGSAVSRHEYENLKKTQELISKTENDLTQDDKNFINKQLNPISHFFSDYTKEDFEEFKDKATQDLVNADVQSKLNFLNTIHQEKSITSILTGSDEKTKNDYLQAVQTIAKEAGFEGIAYDKKGDVFFYDHENFYKPNQDFFGNFLNILASNAGSIGGGITGAIVGAKNAKNPQQALIGSVVGAGIGSFIGASSDVLLTNARLNRENTLKEVLAHSLEEGTLSVVGDLAIMGGAMAVKNGLKILKDSNVAQKTSETFKNIVEYTPIIGFVSRFQDGNAKSALKLVSNTIDETQQKALHDFGESFGGNIKFGSQDNFRAYENIKAKFGENHFITKGAKIINDAFMLKSQSQAQKTILQAIRADESGNLVAFLSEAANASPTLQNSLKSLLNQTTFNLKKQLQYLDLKPNEVKEIFDTFQKGTKTEYAQAIDEVLTKVYDDTYKVKIDPSKYNNFRIQLEQSGVLPEDSLRFLEFAQKNIYNQQGVSFTQLNNALKQINSYYKTATDPNFKDFTAKAVENFLRDDIKQGIDSIFAQNKTLYKDAQSLFSSALSDYGKMKATLKLVDKIKLRDESISYEQAFKNLYKYVKGQGGELQNLTKLTQHLDKNSAQRVELSILYNLFNQNIKDFKDIQVFDSQAFFKNLESIKDHFNTQSAKDFIDIAKGFDTLFKNDVLIANAIRNATTDKISSSIATTIQGAVKFQLVRMMFENIVRLLPNIPFMSSLNEKVQGASLRFHIKRALMKNLDVQDFKISLSNKAKYNKEFNSQTKQALENIIGKIDKAQDEMLEYANLATQKTNDDINTSIQKQASSNINSTLQNPSIEFALQEFPEFSKAELEEMLTKGIRGEARTKEGITKQDIEYFKDNTLYKSEIANYRDEELGMYGDTFHLAKLQKIENVINPTNWEASLKTLLDKALTLAKNKDTLQQAQDLMHSIHLNNPSFFTPLNPNYPKIKEILNEYQERLNTLVAQSPQDIKFIDTKGKEHTLSKDTQKQWLQTFGLQNLEQSYIPKHSQAIQQALGGKEIRLTKGSLLKLVSKEREQYIPQVKETLDNPDYILKDIDGMIILAKKIDDKQYFTSINLETDDFLISISNAPKKENILKNKVEKGAKIIYQSPNSESIFYTPELLQASQSLANKIDSSNSTIKDQSKQHKGQEELKNIFDEFEQQDKTLQDKAKLLKEHKEDLKSKDLVGSEKWESLMEQQSLLIDEESQILERAYKKAKRLMPHFSSYEEILQYEPINKVSLRLLKENVNEIMDKEIRALQDTSITKADFKQALDEFNTFYKEYRDYHKPLYYEFETKFGFYTREFNKQKLSNAKDVEMFKKYFLDKKPSEFNDKLKQAYETIQQYNQLELQNRQRMQGSKESELITSKAIEIKEQLNNKYKNSIQKQEISKQSENPHAQNFDQATNSKELESGNNLSLMDSAPNSTTKNTNPIQNTATLHNPSIPTPQELQIQVDKVKADIDELMKNPQIVDKQWLYRVNKPQEVETIQAHYFNQEIPQEYQEIIAPFPKLREQEIADTLKQHTQTQLKQAHKEQFLETFKDKPFEKTRIQASNLLKTYYEHNPKGLGVEIKDWNFESANFKMALAKFQTKLKKGDEEVFETLWEAKFAKNIQDKRQEIQNLFSINPIKEFGTNYAEFYKDGKGAIQKLLAERQGQVAGAFHKEGLGDIDLVWGDSKMGLAHIIERRMQDFIEKGFSKAEAEQKTLEFAKSLPDIIENGNIDKRIARAFLETQDSKAVIALDFNDKDNKWILTAYNKDDALNPAYSHQVKHNTNTSSETRASGDKEIIPQNANTINILKDMQDKDINATFDNSKLQSEKQGSNSASLTKGETLPLNFKEDSSTKNTKYTIRELKTPSDEELKQITQAYTQDNELLKQRKEIIQSYSNKIEKTKSKKIKQRLRDEQLEKLGQINQKIDDDYALFLRKNGVDTKAMEIKIQLERSERYAKPLFDLLEGFSDKELREYKVRYKNIDTYRDSYLDVGDKRFTEGKGLSISTLQNILLTKLNMSEYPKEIQYAYFDSPLFYHARWGKIETKPDSELIYLGGLSFDEMVMNRERKDLEYLFDIKPIKEFGTNYAEFYKDGKGAIQKLLSEAKDYETRKEAGSLTEDEVKQGAYKGQVAGAFHKEGLGDIDLVWGDSKKGLAHILERRTDDFIKQGLSKEEAQTKARELIGQIPEILEQSTIYRQNDSKIELVTSRHTLVLGLRDDRKFIITELIDKRNKKRLGSSQTGVADTLTDETLTNKSLSSSQHLDTSTTPADPHQSGFADSNFSTSLKSEAKNDFNPTTKDLIQQSKYISKIMDLNKKNNKATLDKKNKLIQEFKQKEPQIYQAMVRKEVYRHYHNKGLYLDDHIVDPDDFLDQYNYIYKREQARQNQNHKHHIETKLEQYKEELENILNNLDSIKNPITQLKKLNLKIAKLPIKQAFGDPVHKDAVLSLSDTIDTALSDIFAKLPQYTENKKQILQESKTKTQEFITYMQEVRGDIDYMLDANPKAIKPYIQERLKEAKPYEKKFLERIQDQVKQIEEKNKDSAPNLGTKVPTTKNTTSQTKEQSFQAQKPLTQKQIQQTLEARKQELIKASKDLELESKSLEKETLKVAPILAELNKEWKELNPFMIKWKERKKLYGNFGQVVGQEKRLSKRKPNLKNLEHIKETLSAYKIYANNGEQQAKQVEKEIALLESYVKRLEDKPNIQELREKTQIQEQALSNERRMINSYNDLREVFNRGAYTDKHILETSNLPKEKQEEIKEFIAQTREYLENTFAITPIKEFGTNYAEFCKDGKGAIQKLLAERQGQVAGAFHKEGLGDIDLVWGDSKMGLQKIITKHIDDFNDFAGETQQAKLANGLSEIVENGKVVSENGVNTIWYKRGDDYYLVGLSKGFNGIGENEWIITSYEKRDLTANQKADINSKIQDSDTKALSPVSEFNELQSLNSTIDSNPTTKDLIKEAKEQDLSVQETKEAMQDSTQATQDLTHLKQKLENASDEEKGEIIKEAITEQNNKLLEEITKLQNVLEKKDFLPFEIDEKIKSLSTKSQFIGEDEESLKKVAISQLEFETKDKIKELQKVLKDNKIGLGTLKEFLTKAKDPKIIENKTAYESVKATLKRLIEKNQKRVLKILDNAIQERKLTYYLNTKDGEERGRKLFYSFKPDTEQIELFEKIFPIAQKLGVEVKQAINNEFLSKEADGVYYTQGNSLRVKNNRIYQEKGKVFLHELIHSVTSRAMIAYESGKRELLSPNQIVAINNIQKLYKEVYKNHKELGFETFESFFTGHKGDYGLKNSHEFVAELSNPIFREKLKKVGVFEKLVDNILRLFVSAKEALGLAKTNAYESLKKNLYDIIDNYKDDFTANYEKENIKGVNLEQSKELESRFLNSTGELNIEALKNEATKLPKQLKEIEFIRSAKKDSKGYFVDTPIGRVDFKNILKTYRHLYENTYMQDRRELSGAFMETLKNPLFVVRQKYPLNSTALTQAKHSQITPSPSSHKKNTKSLNGEVKTKSIIHDSYVFYKPFVSENGLVSLASFAISQNGELLHKTFYDIKTLSKLKKLIKGDDEDLLYFKNSKDLLNPQN